VPDSPADQRQSLRERKKQATRRMLVDAAVELCITQGYESTTVEQIAAAAEISTRTFSRYFATKDAVFVAVLDDLADEIVRELTSQPSHLGPMEALRAAHMAVLERASRRTLEGLTTERLALILRVINASDALRQAAIDYRSEATVRILAERMGVSPDARSLDLAIALFSTTIVRACEEVAEHADVLSAPQAIMARLDATLGDVAQFAAQMDVTPKPI
jgi:AcrR family transcriptional regulator